MILLLACAQPCAEGGLEIGGGDLAWEALPDPTPIVRGPQGGLHVFGSLRTDALTQGTDALDDVQNPLLDFQVLDGDTVVGGYAGMRRHFAEAGDVLELVGERLILLGNDPAALDGVAVTIAARLVDACGGEREAGVETTLLAPVDTGGDGGDTGL